MADVSLIPGNPAHRIRSNYQQLMTIGCPDQLRAEALKLLEAGGISEKNARKFKQAVATERSLPRLQFYLTNFVLASDPSTRVLRSA